VLVVGLASCAALGVQLREASRAGSLNSARTAGVVNSSSMV